MFLHLAQRYQLVFKGWTARTCPRCSTARAFSCWSKMLSQEINFVQVSNKEVCKVLACEFCAGTLDLPKREEPAVSTEWNPALALQDLADETNPQLGRIPAPKEPTPEQLGALLLVIKERTTGFRTRLKVAGPLGTVIGLAAGAALGLGLGVALFHAGVRLGSDDPLELYCYSLLAGAGLGGTLGGALSARKTLREQSRLMLREAIAKHKLDCERLRLAVLNNPSIPRHLLAVLDEPAGGPEA